MALIDTLKSKFNNNKKVAENYFFMTFLASSALVIGLIIYPYAVRVLGKEAYGIYVFVFSNVQLFQLITTFGFDTPALKKIALFPDNREVKSRVVSEVLISKSLLFCLSLIVLTVVSRFIPFLQKHILLYYILFSLQLVEILFPTWYFQGIQKMKFVTYTNLIIRMSTIPLVFIFVHSPNDLLLYAVIVSLLPLVGIIYSGVISAAAEILAYRFDLVQSMTSWTQGSFAMIQTHQYEWLFLSFVILIAVWRLSATFTIMNLGEDASHNLGISFYQMEGLSLFLIALTTSVTMITVGSLPFIGVIVPNIVRKFYGDHITRIKSITALTGAGLILICDIMSRMVIRPYEISVSLILGIFGSLTFIYLLWRGATHE